MKNTTTKKWHCKKCGIKRPIGEFEVHQGYKFGRSTVCNNCLKPKEKIYKKIPKKFKNPQDWLNYKEHKYEKFKEIWCYTCQKWLNENNFHEGNTSGCKNCVSLKMKNYYQKPGVKNRTNKQKRERLKTDPIFKLNKKISYGIRQSLNGNKKGIKWETLVGYTASDLKKHIEKQFKPDMSWENHGEWHIDHIIPISKFNFTKPEHSDFKKCWALKNLQPLWALENIKKSNKLIKPFQPSLLL